MTHPWIEHNQKLLAAIGEAYLELKDRYGGKAMTVQMINQCIAYYDQKEEADDTVR